MEQMDTTPKIIFFNPMIDNVGITSLESIGSLGCIFFKNQTYSRLENCELKR